MKKNSKNDSSNNNNNNNEQVDWEMRPGGMLVQRRDDDNHDHQDGAAASASGGPVIRINVARGPSQYEVHVPARSTFGISLCIWPHLQFALKFLLLLIFFYQFLFIMNGITGACFCFQKICICIDDIVAMLSERKFIIIRVTCKIWRQLRRSCVKWNQLVSIILLEVER